MESKFTEIRISVADDGLRLDVFLSRKFNRSRSAIRNTLGGAVLSAAGRPLKWSHKLRQGELIRVKSRVVPEPEVQVTYRLLHQDPHILAVDKGAGAPVHPVRSWRSRTVLTRLREQTGDLGLKPAHRLDRETSGVLLFGRTTKALTHLMSQFKNGQVEKRYLAVVRGCPGFDRVEVDEPLARDPNFPIQCRMQVDRDRGQAAVTRFEVLDRGVDAALVSARPRTGRQHQIRVHLAHLGHPVLGDKLYQDQGRPYLAMIKDALDPETLSRLGHHRQALHAERLSLVHPGTGQEMLLQAVLPADLQTLLG